MGGTIVVECTGPKRRVSAHVVVTSEESFTAAKSSFILQDVGFYYAYHQRSFLL
jgi:hypothetical protein